METKATSKGKTPSAVERKIQAQEIFLKEITKYVERFEAEESAHTSRALLNTWLTEMQESFSASKETHQRIIAGGQDAAQEKYFEDEIFAKIHGAYFKILGKIYAALDKLDASTSKSVDVSRSEQPKSTSSELRLPRINIKQFSGKFEDWCEFSGLFKSMIHQNCELSKVQKLQYLKGFLTEEPARLIQHLPIEGKHYDSAWEIITDRFDNKRRLVNTQLRRLLEQPKVIQESAAALKTLHDVTTECTHALTNLEVDITTWDPILIYLLLQKLPSASQRDWENKQGSSKTLPSFKSLLTFIEGKFSSLENFLEWNRQPLKESTFHSGPRTTRNFHTQPQQRNQCPRCRQAHPLRTCKNFRAGSTTDRNEVVKKYSLCVNCLGGDHLAANCPSNNRCFRCGLKHHTLLHIDSKYRPSTNQPATRDTTVISNFNQIKSKVLLATALVDVQSIDGTKHTLRALIDPGSEASFITERAIQQLRINWSRVAAKVTGLGQALTGETTKLSNIKVFSKTTTYHFELQVFVFPKITSLLPSEQVDISHWEHLAGLKLADPSYSCPAKIDLLLGADIYSSIILQGLIKSQAGSPVAQNTKLGWIISGRTNQNPHLRKISVQTHHHSLEVQLKKFWELEEILEDRRLTEEEEMCQQHYKQTVRRRQDGRYEVQLPFKNNCRPILGGSRPAALARLLHLERKLELDQELKAAYTECMDGYVALGHMQEEPVTTRHTTGNHYFLPHHAVLKETSTTTKLRVVFDASCKTTDGSSLNDHLLVGPKLQTDILELIVHWRKFRVAFSADIIKMYRQIWMAPGDTPYQLILWRPEKKQPIRTYSLQTVTFGTASAPYLAIRTLHQLAEDVKDTYPDISRILMEGFYVDDLIYGADTEQQAIAMQKDLIAVLASAGMPIRKWASNSNTLLQQVSEHEREINLPLEFGTAETIKTLGIQWHPTKDVFTFNFNLPEVKTYTKRSVLADIARIFDPLGWISPCIIKAKLILQQLWRTEATWDSPLPEAITDEWQRLRQGLEALRVIEIPRWHGGACTDLVQLHGFSDASENAYAAVIYARVICNGEEHISLVTSKTRVAPLKRICLPRLELCAAQLLARLLHKVLRAMKISHVGTYAWSDSTICLAWIRGSPAIRTTFVANRVTEIQRLIGSSAWHHVGTKDNPADVASRGLSGGDLIADHKWWHGPDFLRGFSMKQHTKAVDLDTDLELKKVPDTTKGPTFTTRNFTLINTHIIHLVAHNVLIHNQLIHRFSTLQRLIRSTAIWRRFFSNLREGKLPLTTHPLTVQELDLAQRQLIKLVQRETFQDEIEALSRKHEISRGSCLVRLTPFLDGEGILRVGGRLDKATLPYNQKHPIILPGSHHFTTLIIGDTHLKTLHGGQQLMMAELRTTFWIVNLKRAVKSIIHRCVRCHRHDALWQQQLMGSLPTERTSITRPFTNTGVDYAGPVDIKPWKGRCTRSIKGYISIFVCLSTKAVHIELVSDLSAAAFIAAYKRFVARRGMCANLYSDCGTNFKGAWNEFQRLHKTITSEWSSEVQQFLTTQRTTWHFNPPAAPHFGGLWEAGVKAIKHHLARTIGSAKLTFEEFNTVLTQIEACLNSRPLCPLSNDPNDLEILTPGHFLIGTALRVAPDKNCVENPSNHLDRWKFIERLTQQFWKQWSATYLHHLQHRPKWLHRKPNIQLGDIVLVKEDNLPPTAWLLARVQEIHPGKDGLVRVVTVRTATSILKRPITKISPLPIDGSTQMAVAEPSGDLISRT